jgi:PEGA domain-containing protein
MDSRVRAEKPSGSDTVPTSTKPNATPPVPTHHLGLAVSRGGLKPRGWLGRLIGGLPGLGRGPQSQASVDGNPLLAFAAEEAPRSNTAAPASTSQRSTSRRIVVPVAIAVLVGIAAIGSVAVTRLALVRVPGPEMRPGVLRVETQPAGAAVFIDGTARGVTPLTLSLTPGAHKMTVGGEGDERAVPLSIAPGAEITQYFELKTSAPVAVTGLAVVTDPPGARISVDGISVDGHARGIAPLTIPDLSPGEYRVTATSDIGSAERTVRVEQGAIASLVFSLPKVAGALGGWISVKAPFDVDVLENAEVIGTGDIAKIMLTAGRHDIVLVNRALDYREARKIDVAAGSTTAVRVEAPAAIVSANARPWADVAIDGKSVGQTPISNLQVPIGTHEVVFRHPRLGERRQTVTVTMNGPNRFAVDLAN